MEDSPAEFVQTFLPARSDQDLPTQERVCKWSVDGLLTVLLISTNGLLFSMAVDHQEQVDMDALRMGRLTNQPGARIQPPPFMGEGVLARQ